MTDSRNLASREKLFENFKTQDKSFKVKILEVFYSVQFSCSVVSDSLWPHGLHSSLKKYVCDA